MILPDIYFVFDWGRGERPFYFHRDPAGSIRRIIPSEVQPAKGSLLMYGPGIPIWNDDDLVVLSRVRDSGGAVLALGSVLARCGFPARIPREVLLVRLGGTHVEMDDPRMEGRKILERLA